MLKHQMGFTFYLCNPRNFWSNILECSKFIEIFFSEELGWRRRKHIFERSPCRWGEVWWSWCWERVIKVGLEMLRNDTGRISRANP